jgi:ABC-2 type transport system permease protein
MQPKKGNFLDGLNTIWTIASKDIVEAIKNKIVLSLILVMGLMLFLPQIFSLILVRPHITVVVYDPAGSALSTALDEDPGYEVQAARSMEELEALVANAPEERLGLVISEDFDSQLDAGETPWIEGYVTWTNRYKADDLQEEYQTFIQDLLGTQVEINVADNIIYPNPDVAIVSRLQTLNAIALVIMMGMMLVPSLLLEEKQTKTMDALLISPANITQVVIGKALAGLFLVLVAAAVVFAATWTSIIAWPYAVVFTLATAIFSVGVGLVLGSFFERPQDATGVTVLLVVLFIGSILADALGLSMPVWAQTAVSWIPSVALSKIFQYAFYQNLPLADFWSNLWIVASVSAVLYGVVIWKVARSDR